jgi:hypothetical protein
MRLRLIRYALGSVAAVFLAAGGSWLAGVKPLIPLSSETGGREAFFAFLRASDSGVPAATALKMASPLPAVIPTAMRSAECAAQYRWDFTRSGSEYGTVCLDAAGKVISTGGGMQFDLRSH